MADGGGRIHALAPEGQRETVLIIDALERAAAYGDAPDPDTLADAADLLRRFCLSVKSGSAQAPTSLVASKLKGVRERQGYTKADLAKFLRTSRGRVYHWEHGSPMYRTTFVRLAYALGVDESELAPIPYAGKRRVEWD